MSPEPASTGAQESAPLPRLGVGTIVKHLQFGVGRIVAYEPGQYVIVFRGGDTRHVAFGYDGLEVEERRGDPETDRIRQAGTNPPGFVNPPWIHTNQFGPAAGVCFAAWPGVAVWPGRAPFVVAAGWLGWSPLPTAF